MNYTNLSADFFRNLLVVCAQCIHPDIDCESLLTLPSPACLMTQIVGKVYADPECLPRTQDFGLNIGKFVEKFLPEDSPAAFFPLTVACCDLAPDNR